MKVLILTTATGQGHNEAAEALRKKYIANKHEVKVLDFIPSTSKLAKSLIIDGYELLATKHPLLYGKLYKITNNKITSSSVDLLLRTAGKCVYKAIVNENPDVILIATGSEVALAVNAKTELEKEQVSVRVVAMPSWELFNRQSDQYKEFVLPSIIKKRVAIEMGISLGWERYVGQEGKIISIETFGASGFSLVSANT